MINNEFKSPLIDIHGGGMDLKFPHHENEMAQGCAHDGSIVANYWVHNGMLNIDGEKMSKSLGNVLWASDFIALYGGNVVRWLMLSAHYRAPLNINEETIQNAKSEYEKVEKAIRQAYVKLSLANKEAGHEVDETLFVPFLLALHDDLNTPNAFKALFEANKKLNASLRQRTIDFDQVARILNTIQKMLYVLGIKIDAFTLSDADKELYAAWRSLVKAKDYEQADLYRKQLMDKGIL